MGIRPEERLSEEAATANGDSFTIEVNVVEPLDDVTRREPGERVTIAFPSEEVHVFDKETGESLAAVAGASLVTINDHRRASSRPESSSDDCPKLQ